MCLRKDKHQEGNTSVVDYMIIHINVAFCLILQLEALVFMCVCLI